MTRFELFDRILSVACQASGFEVSTNSEMEKVDPCLDALTFGHRDSLDCKSLYTLLTELAKTLVPERIKAGKLFMTEPNWSEQEQCMFSVIGLKTPDEVAKLEVDKQIPQSYQHPVYQVIDMTNPEIPRCKGAPCFSYEEVRELRATWPTECGLNRFMIYELTPMVLQEDTTD